MEPSPAPSRSPRRQALLTAGACALLLAVFYLTAVVAVSGKSATYDEVIHSTGGYMKLTQRDYRLNAEDPPLPQYWSALPHLFAEPLVNGDTETWEQMLGAPTYQWFWSVRTLYRTPPNDPEAFLLRARAMMALLGVALGALIAGWSWRLGGPVAAVVATVAFTFDPNFLAHAPLVKNDVPFALAWLTVAFTVWIIGRRATFWRILGLGVACGAALTTKFSGPLVVPLLAILLSLRALGPEPWPVLRRTVHTRGRRFATAVAIGLAAGAVAYVCVWAAYGFRFAVTPDGRHFGLSQLGGIVAVNEVTVETGLPPTEAALQKWEPSTTVSTLVRAMENRLFPQSWLYGFLYTYATSLVRGSYLLGDYSNFGWWYYFPVAMMVKTPTATLLALVAAAAVALVAFRSPRAASARTGSPAVFFGRHDLLWATLCLAVPPALYLLTAIGANLNLGLRHVLPVYPFLFIALGLAAAYAYHRLTRARVLLVTAVLVGALVLESALAHPHYIPFFNAPAGGSRGGLDLLGDSNLDWGQDLKLLAEWRKRHPEGKLYLSWFGKADPRYYLGDDFVTLPPGTHVLEQDAVPFASLQDPGYIAISATHLQGIYYPAIRPIVAELRNATPVEILGGSIYIYKFNMP